MSFGATPETRQPPEVPFGELVDPSGAPRPRHPRYRLLWFQIIPVAWLLVIECVFQLPLAHVHTDELRQVWPFMMGHILGGLLIPLVISWIAYRLFRRSELAANISFALMILLIILSSYVDARRTSEKLARELLAAERHHIAEIEKDGHEAANRFGLSMQFDDKTAPTITDRAAKVLHAMKRLDETVQHTDELKSTMRQSHARLEAQLKTEGVVPSVRGQTLDALDDYLQPERSEGNMAASDRLYQAYRKILDYLHDHRGEWSIPPGDGRVRFDTDAKQREYHQLIAESEAAFQALQHRSRELEASTRPSTEPSAGR